jgi:transposase
MRVRDELPGLFADAEFASAFGPRGKPGISPGQLALVTVLQFAENLTDRQAADAVRARIDWKYALGLELTDPGFDHTVLTGFRQRPTDHGLEEKVLDLLLARLSELGLVTARGRQRTDSTQVLAAVRSVNRLEFLAETLRAALEALAAAALDWLAGHIDADWVYRYGARMDSYRRPHGGDKRKQMAVQVGVDGFCLLEMPAKDAPAWLREIPAVTVLRTVWITQYHRTVTGDRQEVAWAGGERPPAQQRPDLLPVRHRRPVCDQTRLRLGGLQSPCHRDLRRSRGQWHAPSHLECGHHRRDRHRRRKARPGPHRPPPAPAQPAPRRAHRERRLHLRRVTRREYTRLRDHPGPPATRR